MALWQVDFFVLPKDSLINGESFKRFSENTFDDAFFWAGRKVHSSFFEEIANFLPRTKSWGDYLLLFGQENSNRFELVVEGDIVESVSFRIDFTSNYLPILTKIIDFCFKNELIILNESLKVMELNTSHFEEFITNSDQYKKYIELTSSLRGGGSLLN